MRCLKERKDGRAYKGASDSAISLYFWWLESGRGKITKLNSLTKVDPKIFEKFKIEAQKKAIKNRGSLKWENKQKGEGL